MSISVAGCGGGGGGSEGKAAVSTGPLPPTGTPTTTVGRWCDKQIPTMPKYNGIMVIVITDDGAVELRERWGDGSSLVTELSEQGGGIYAAVGSGSGDKYRVVPADGNLQLLDNDGLIRVATRLENTPQPGDCGI